MNVAHIFKLICTEKLYDKKSMKKSLLFSLMFSSIVWTGGRPSVEIETPANLSDPSDDSQLILRTESNRRSVTILSSNNDNSDNNDKVSEIQMPSYVKFIYIISPVIIIAAIMNHFLSYMKLC